MNNVTRWLKRNPMSVALLSGIGISTLLSAGNISQNASTIARVRSLTQENSLFQMQLQASEQAKQQRAKVAESRYQSGCVMVVASNDPNSFTTISEGQPVIDSVRRVPLPVGTVVCDAQGNTGEIIQGARLPVVSRIAFTGNRELVKAAMQRINAHYTVPQQ